MNDITHGLHGPPDIVFPGYYCQPCNLHTVSPAWDTDFDHLNGMEGKTGSVDWHALCPECYGAVFGSSLVKGMRIHQHPNVTRGPRNA